ncbi:hypothetical protein HGRIS_002370 [Hohenbuehelia grisea]|uniref:G-alpha-domain-containing protein n=1 Tax=Hohenbuehelia grisea TaxID=104357 RepID=A0ABR3JKR8_9AGAR
MQYARQSWLEERHSWRAVIYLNLVRSVNLITDILSVELDETSTAADGVTLSDQHQILLLRLSPLRRIQASLEDLFATGTFPALRDDRRHSSPLSVMAAARIIRVSDDMDGLDLKPTYAPVLQEFTVFSNCGWKSVLGKSRLPEFSTGTRSPKRRHADPVDEVEDLLCSCKDDIKALWRDLGVKRSLAYHHLRVEDSSGFFLNDVDRIVARGYVPSDEDIVRARLRTMGVQEYSLTLDRGESSRTEWIMYDVAGCRTQRAAWVPYFTDVTAIIFVAPLSCFDEQLAENHRVNRLQDSFQLWDTICCSALLAHVQMILLMNKCDLLEKKLKKDKLRVHDYIPEFQGENNMKTVTTWFHRVFRGIFKRNNPADRHLYTHFTSAVDTRATARTLVGVQEAIMRNHFTGVGLV